MMIEDIRNDMKKNIGKQVKIVTKCCRNKSDVFVGVINGVYPNIFTISDGNETKSFSFSELLIKDITLYFIQVLDFWVFIR